MKWPSLRRTKKKDWPQSLPEPWSFVPLKLDWDKIWAERDRRKVAVPAYDGLYICAYHPDRGATTIMFSTYKNPAGLSVCEPCADRIRSYER